MNQLNEEVHHHKRHQYNLQGIESLAWKKLVNGSVKKKNGFRTMCVGTIDENTAALRIVVNRKVDESNKTIYFHTDNRSRKFSDLEQDNRIRCCFMMQKQIVVKAFATLIPTTLSQMIAGRQPVQARLGYMTLEPPNTKSDQPTLVMKSASQA
jgi:pyridoxine/pyridoxamine 5'-phosphate oxidase